MEFIGGYNIRTADVRCNMSNSEIIGNAGKEHTSCAPKHPAKYTNSFIPIFYSILKDCKKILDPFAGTGKIAEIKNHGFSGTVYCNEIEKEWIGNSLVDFFINCDSSKMPYSNSFFDGICTSPTYGNRMADHFDSKDNSHRVTYRHYLGKELNKNNTGRMQWGNKYKQVHIDVYNECFRVLKNSGLMVVNCANHIRNGNVVDVVSWHKWALKNVGFRFVGEMIIDTKRMGFGKNGKIRIYHESILIYDKKESHIVCDDALQNTMEICHTAPNSHCMQAVQENMQL
jgi:hypothetical protein